MRSVARGPRVAAFARPAGCRGAEVEEAFPAPSLPSKPAVAEMAARQAMHRPAQQAGQSEGVWWLGSVVWYDSQAMTGTVPFLGPRGHGEAWFGASAMRKSGLVSLHPAQNLECLVATRPDGTVAVVDLKIGLKHPSS